MVKFISTNTSLEHPNITVIKGNKVTIIYVCYPFDNDRDALKTAVAAKETKYTDLEQALAVDGKDVEVLVPWPNHIQKVKRFH